MLAARALALAGIALTGLRSVVGDAVDDQVAAYNQERTDKSIATCQPLDAAKLKTQRQSCLSAHSWDGSIIETTCGDQLDGTSRLNTNDNTCDDCAEGTWAAAVTDTCAAHTTCGNQVDGTTSRLKDATKTVAGTCDDCAEGTWAAAVTDTCAAHTTCGNQVDGTTSRLKDATKTAAGTCGECEGGTWAAAVTDTCAAHTTCGKQLDTTPRALSGATAFAGGTCDECATGTWAAGDADCAAHTTCGNQVAVGDAAPVSRLTGATPFADGSCAACSSGTWAAAVTDNCAAHTTCGLQSDLSTPRLEDASTTAAGSCGDCDDGTWAAAVTGNCAAHTTCGNQVAVGDAAPVSRLTGASKTAAGSCADCATNTYSPTGVTGDCINQVSQSCGKQADDTPRLVTTDSTSVCTNCNVGTYAAGPGDDCQSQPDCGLDGDGTTTRALAGDSLTIKGYCTACTSGYDDSVGGDADCKAWTTCGNQADGSSRLTGATATAGPGSCAACAGQTSAVSTTDNCAATTASTCGSQTDGTLRWDGSSCGECTEPWEFAADDAANCICNSRGACNLGEEAACANAGNSNHDSGCTFSRSGRSFKIQGISVEDKDSPFTKTQTAPHNHESQTFDSLEEAYAHPWSHECYDSDGKLSLYVPAGWSAGNEITCMKNPLVDFTIDTGDDVDTEDQSKILNRWYRVQEICTSGNGLSVGENPVVCKQSVDCVKGFVDQDGVQQTRTPGPTDCAGIDQSITQTVITPAQYGGFCDDTLVTEPCAEVVCEVGYEGVKDRVPVAGDCPADGGTLKQTILTADTVLRGDCATLATHICERGQGSFKGLDCVLSASSADPAECTSCGQIVDNVVTPADGGSCTPDTHTCVAGDGANGDLVCAAQPLAESEIADGMVFPRESGDFNLPRWLKVTADPGGSGSFKIQYCQTTNVCSAEAEADGQSGGPGAGHGWAYNYFPGGTGAVGDTYWTAAAAAAAGAATGDGECVVVAGEYYKSSWETNADGSKADQLMSTNYLARTSRHAWPKITANSPPASTNGVDSYLRVAHKKGGGNELGCPAITKVSGCTNPDAGNYNSLANADDYSCCWNTDAQKAKLDSWASQCPTCAASTDPTHTTATGTSVPHPFYCINGGTIGGSNTAGCTCACPAGKSGDHCQNAAAVTECSLLENGAFFLENGDRGDCPTTNILGLTAYCNPQCNTGYSTGIALTYCKNDGSLQKTTCIANACENVQSAVQYKTTAGDQTACESDNDGFTWHEFAEAGKKCAKSNNYPDNGGYMNCNNLLNSGDTCNSGCDAGYTTYDSTTGGELPDTDSETTCTAGALTHNFECDKPCSTGSLSNYDYAAGDCAASLRQGATCQPVCADGYQTTNANAPTTCGLDANGNAKLTHTLTCTRTPCSTGYDTADADTLPANAKGFGGCVDTLGQGSSCQLTCAAGYSSSLATCSTDDRTFTGAVCEPDSCDVSQPPENGALGDCPNQLAHGATCTPTCNTGYTVSSSITCDLGSFTAATCIPDGCDATDIGSVCTETSLASGATCAHTCADDSHVGTPSSCTAGVFTQGTCVADTCAAWTASTNAGDSTYGFEQGTCNSADLASGGSCKPVCAPNFASGGKIANSDEFTANTDATASEWPFVLTTTTIDDGADSNFAQSFTMNVVSLPSGGANFRLYEIVSSGAEQNGEAVALTTGSNTFRINEVGGSSQNRTIKFQFSSGDVEFDLLEVNDVTKHLTTTTCSQGTLTHNLVCTKQIRGCTDNTKLGYYNVNDGTAKTPGANVDDGTCGSVEAKLGCTDSNYVEYYESDGDPENYNVNDGSCATTAVFGCTLVNDLNYKVDANGNTLANVYRADDCANLWPVHARASNCPAGQQITREDDCRKRKAAVGNTGDFRIVDDAAEPPGCYLTIENGATVYNYNTHSAPTGSCNDDTYAQSRKCICIDTTKATCDRADGANDFNALTSAKRASLCTASCEPVYQDYEYKFLTSGATQVTCSNTELASYTCQSNDGRCDPFISFANAGDWLDTAVSSDNWQKASITVAESMTVDAKSFSINIHSLPTGGATYRTFERKKTGNVYTAAACTNGGDATTEAACTDAGNVYTAATCTNDGDAASKDSCEITVGGVITLAGQSANGYNQLAENFVGLIEINYPEATYKRTLQVQFDKSDVDFSSLTVNDVLQWPAEGCTDDKKLGYYGSDGTTPKDPLAHFDDGSCGNARVLGCTDDTKLGYYAAPARITPKYPVANVNDGSCGDTRVLGCTDSTKVGYYNVNDGTSKGANVDDGSCGVTAVFGCTDDRKLGYYESDGITPKDPVANVQYGSCGDFRIFGCTDAGDTGYYKPDGTSKGANVLRSEMCTGVTAVLGCTDSTKLGYYNVNNGTSKGANVDDGSCGDVTAVFGCTDDTRLGYYNADGITPKDPVANIGGSCGDTRVLGCTDSTKVGYYDVNDGTAKTPGANVDDGLCGDVTAVFGCADDTKVGYYNPDGTVRFPGANVNNRCGSATAALGCTNTIYQEFYNYDATDGYSLKTNIPIRDDGSCANYLPLIPGCPHTQAFNFDFLATKDDGSCFQARKVSDGVFFKESVAHQTGFPYESEVRGTSTPSGSRHLSTTLDINIVKLPEGGATYRIRHVVNQDGNENQVQQPGTAVSLVLGVNTITTPSYTTGDNVDVYIQFSSGDVMFRHLEQDGVKLYDGSFADVPNLINSSPGLPALEAVDTYRNFNYRIRLKQSTDSDSHKAQTVVIDVHSATPSSQVGASYALKHYDHKYQVIRTGSDGHQILNNGAEWTASDALTSLNNGENTISVPAVGYTRDIYIYFQIGVRGSRVDNTYEVAPDAFLRYNLLRVNGVQTYPDPFVFGCKDQNYAEYYQDANREANQLCQTDITCTASSNPQKDGSDSTESEFYCIHGGTIGGTRGSCTCTSCDTGYSGASCQTAGACTASTDSAKDGSDGEFYCINGGTIGGTTGSCTCTSCDAGFYGSSCADTADAGGEASTDTTDAGGEDGTHSAAPSGVDITNSLEFTANTGATASAWPYTLTATTAAEGALSHKAQTFTMNVLQLPAEGAQFYALRTNTDGSEDAAVAQDLIVGSNTFTVPAVNFDRAVKFQFSSGNVAFDQLSVNGVTKYPASAYNSHD